MLRAVLWTLALSRLPQPLVVAVDTEKLYRLGGFLRLGRSTRLGRICGNRSSVLRARLGRASTLSRPLPIVSGRAVKGHHLRHRFLSLTALTISLAE
jgi:hypothetical protein